MLLERQWLLLNCQLLNCQGCCDILRIGHGIHLFVVRRLHLRRSFGSDTTWFLAILAVALEGHTQDLIGKWVPCQTDPAKS
jgi:hypothetical protein